MTMTTIYAFAYGTLRPSGALDDLAPGRHLGQARMSGLLYRHHDARFPVMADTVAEHNAPTVVGDLFAVDISDLKHRRNLDFVTDMEVGAGYLARVRECVVLNVTDPLAIAYREVRPGDIVAATVFLWPTSEPVGPRIFCGDWFSTEAATACSDLGASAGFTTRRYR